MRAAFLIYTGYRLAIFVVLTGLLWLLGLNGLLLVLAALVLSLPASYLLLGRQRAELSRQIELRMEQRQARREAFRARLRGEEPAGEPEPDDPEER
ncbi:MAG TPA: DUF4229 domain-containing protein [Mycobacteriales bacterium]